MYLLLLCNIGFPGGPVVKKLYAIVGDTGDAGSISGSRRFPGGGNGNPFQYSCPENSMGRGAWRATFHGVTESDMTGQLSTHMGY